MEGAIRSLVQDFEDGRLDRRQLIQGLMVLAMGASTAAQAPSSPRAPWKTVHLDHISYAVSDYRKSAAFYSNLMGWEVVNDNGTNQATLRIGSLGDIIIRNARRPEGVTAAAGAGATASAADGRPPVTGVINHISWGIEPWDTEGVKAELERRGLNPRPDMQGAEFKSYHVLDPDGWDLQISNQVKVG